MARFTLRPKAIEDLEAIWHYTVSTWGNLQADTYIRQLSEGIRVLASDPAIGQACDYVREGYRKYPVNRHIIFYRVIAAEEIDVVRILHERMDVDRHL
ncbi:MAG: type II toxin-antitoxin system RelE/ParE family toxin [Anaerolineae bacterium]